MNRIGSIVVWLIGEILLTALFLHIGLKMTEINLIVDFVVSSIVWTVVAICLFRNDDVMRKHGVSKGMKWFFTITYSFLAISGMLYFDLLNPVDILTQTIVQLIFLSVLAMGMLGAFKPAKKDEKNPIYIKREQNQLLMIRNVASIAKTKAEKRADLPVSVRQEISSLEAEVQRMTPGNELVSLKMEGRIMLEMNRILDYLKQENLDLKSLNYSLKSCFKLIAEFMDTYGQV